MAVSAPAVLLAPDAIRFRRALLAAGDPSRFRDLPVDWHDPRAGTWRPTAIAQARPHRRETRVEVFVPIDDGVAMAPAPVAELRLARGGSDAVTRFWTLRYRLRLLRSLAAVLPPGEAELVDRAIHELRGAESEMRDVWLTAYAHGVPPRPARTLLRPGDVRLVPERHYEHEAMAGRCPSGPGGLLERAVTLYGSELARLHAALGAAGLSDHEAGRHPLCGALAALIAAAAEELRRCASRPDPGFDLSVWASNTVA